MDNNIFEIKQIGDNYEVKEVTIYTTSKQDLEQQLHQIRMNKKNIVEQMNRMRVDYDRFDVREKQLEAAIADTTPEEIPAIPEV